MRDEWKYILNTKDAYISFDGDVMQRDKIVKPYRSGSGHRMVELLLEGDEYNPRTRGYEYIPVEERVYSLVLAAWFDSIPRGGQPYFLDGDLFNCSAENVRVAIFDPKLGYDRVVHAREESWGFVFDKRRRGRVECIETGEVFDGVNQAAQAVSGTAQGISKVLSGVLQSHVGLHFRWN